MLVIGSKALEAWNIPIARKPGDLDVVCTLEEYNQEVRTLKNLGCLAFAKPLNGKKFHIRTKEGWNVECEIAWEGSTGAKLIELVIQNGLHLPYEEQDGCFFVSPDVVLALKLSHRYLKNNPFFLKTMQDIRMLREMGYTVPECLKEWLKEREKETYDYGHPSLMQRKQDFFDASVQYVWQHDDLHEAIKLYDKPAYQYYKPEDKEVWCSKEMFDACGHEIKLAGVYEEACVLALERCLIPFDFQTPPKKAFEMALEKVCTSITSGFFREFAYEHYQSVVALYAVEHTHNAGYVAAFQKAEAGGRVRKHGYENNSLEGKAVGH